MQAQTTGSRRFGFNRMVMAALAIGILAIAATLAASNIEIGADKSVSTLLAHPAPLQGEGRIDPANAVSATSRMLPVIRYAAPFAGEGMADMRFIESGFDWRLMAPIDHSASQAGEGLVDPANRATFEAQSGGVTVPFDEGMGEGRLDSHN